MKKFRKLTPMWAQIDLNDTETEFKTWKEGDIIWRGQAQKGSWMNSTGHGIVRAIEPGQYIVETQRQYGKAHGYVRCINADGTYLTGHWKDNKKFGEWRLYNVHGHLVEHYVVDESGNQNYV